MPKEFMQTLLGFEESHIGSIQAVADVRLLISYFWINDFPSFLTNA